MAILSIVMMLALSATLQHVSSMPDFNSNNHLKKDLDNNFRSKNIVFKAPRCSMDEVSSIISIRELQDIVERFAERGYLSPFMVLKKLFDRMKNRKNSDEIFLNTLEGAELQQLLQSNLDVQPTVSQSQVIPRVPSFTPYGVPPSDNQVPKKPFLIVPNNIRPGADNGRPTVTQFVPLMSSFNRPFIPPETATVHVTSLPDIPVTVSPFMTVIEALQQADNEYRAVLGIKMKFGFGRSVIHGIECVVIKSILDLLEGQDYMWKITISDRDGQVIYQGVCLPDEKKVRIKGGTDITLSYVSLLD